MKFKNKRRWKIIKDFSIGWTLSFIFLCIVRGEGTRELGSVQFEFWPSIFYSLLMGPIFGCISGFAEVLSEEKIYKRISLQKLLLLRLVYSLLFLTTLVLISYATVTLFYGVKIGLVDFTIEPGSFAIYFYIISVDFFMVVLRQVNLLLGENNLGKLLLGKFYTPREEERIFMFLDLQSSTKHAERLGHISYSKMIQDCFYDLGVVVKNEAEIYQYAGDEVILTWRLKEGLKNHNCINAYFNFKQQLKQKENYYLDNYNCKPFFKAGLNEGIVTVTEVGKYKKEIAYHGDTLNTAARIQGKCNELNQELLISENLRVKMYSSNFKFDKLGSIALRGKEKEIPVYGASFDCN